jgi:hypothetical protein
MTENADSTNNPASRDIFAIVADIDERFPKLVAKCPYETRLAITAWVLRHLCDHARTGTSFRGLIYGRLGFGEDAYRPLLLAGAMEISNEFNLPPLTDAPDTEG